MNKKNDPNDEVIRTTLDRAVHLIRSHSPQPEWGKWVQYFSDEMDVPSPNEESLFVTIDSLRAKVDACKKEPEFSQEIAKRSQRQFPEEIQDQAMLAEMAGVIAFSQSAKANLVEVMIEQGHLSRAFADFAVSRVARMDPLTVEQVHWPNISVIRFKKKLGAIIQCAESLLEIQQEYGSFAGLIKTIDLPKQLNHFGDIDEFWQKFFILQKRIKQARFPYFHQTTSLLHMLLNFGFPCVKPDKIVMNVATELGMTGNLIEVVKQIQRYAVSRTMVPAVVDFYLLVYGGQTSTIHFLEKPLRSRL